MNTTGVVVIAVLLLIAILAIVYGLKSDHKNSNNKQGLNNNNQDEKLNDISGLAGFLAWLNLIGGTFGFIYYTFIKVLELGDLKVRASRTVIEQIQAAQVSSVFLGISLLLAGLTLFVIIQLLRGIYRNSRVK